MRRVRRIVMGLKAKPVADDVEEKCPACVDGHIRDKKGTISRCRRCSGHGKVWSSTKV